ncbi:MAG: hypothetical protein HQL58_04105 [Magnetococcales bacterium]|nr:hypothetical protein [Magnetococcales bacterium]
MIWINRLLRRWQDWHQTSDDPIHQEMLLLHDRLVDRTLDLTSNGVLDLPDDFSLRFEVLVFLVAVALHHFRQHVASNPLHQQRAQQLWEITFEGFDHGLRQKGVSDIRMSARMHKLLQQATGRRNAYLTALEQGDELLLRQAISRNILNQPDAVTVVDPRVERLLERLHTLTQELAHE